jgi:hypothetical protein
MVTFLERKGEAHFVNILILNTKNSIVFTVRSVKCYQVTYLITELSPFWEAANCAATQELPTILWNPFQYRVHESPPLVPVPNHINPIHTIPSYLSTIHYNIIHSPTSWSSQWSLSFLLTRQYSTCIPLLPHLCYMPRSSLSSNIVLLNI